MSVTWEQPSLLDAPPGNDSRIDVAFADWIQSDYGQAVLAAFCKVAVAQRRRGKTTGAKGVAEILRDRPEDFGLSPTGWKIDNRFVSRLARQAMFQVPELEGHFRLKGLKSG